MIQSIQIAVLMLCAYLAITSADVVGNQTGIVNFAKHDNNSSVFSIEDSEQKYPIPPSIKLRSLDGSVYRLKECRHGAYIYSSTYILLVTNFSDCVKLMIFILAGRWIYMENGVTKRF